MAQSYNCACLDPDYRELCLTNEHCQYKLRPGILEDPAVCGKDLLLKLQRDAMGSVPKEPELVICPDVGNCSDLGCAARQPHSKSSFCKNINCHVGVRSSPCIPYKKEEPTATQQDRIERVKAEMDEWIENLRGCRDENNAKTILQKERPIDIQQAHTAQIDALTERVDAAVQELSDARQKVAASKEVIRENIELKEALAEMQVKFQKEREAHAVTFGKCGEVERDYIGKLNELHRSFETVAQALEDGRVKCAGLEKENAAIKAALKAVL